MIQTLKINGYRGFDRFEMKGLKHVNLLVGNNNSGKTSVLEAVQILAAEGDPGALWRIMERRHEYFISVPAPVSGRVMQGLSHQEFDVCHLFHGHQLKEDVSFSINAANKAQERSIAYTVQEAKQESLALFPPDGDPAGPRLALYVKGTPAPTPAVSMIPLTRRESVRLDTYNVLNRMPNSERDVLSYQFVDSYSLSVIELAELWNGLQLTPAENRVIRALQFLEPRIESIRGVNVVSRPGFIVKLRDVEKPIPIGSLGDGIWRMFALAVAISVPKDGLLLVDEIDSGLHYSVMSDMWRMVIKAARELNIQVFATTHSEDCIRSLAAVCQEDEADEISLQRLEPERGRAVAYTENQIKIAAEQHIEVR